MISAHAHPTFELSDAAPLLAKTAAREQKLESWSDISFLKTSRAFDIQLHSRALLAAVVYWLATL